MADRNLKSITFPGLPNRYVIPDGAEIDSSLTQQGKAADAKAVGDALKAGIAPAYSASSTYAVGEYVMYNNALYRCTTAITTAEAWTAAHWTAAQIGEDLTDCSRQLSDLGNVTAFKEAILQLAQKVAYTDEHGQDYYNDLVDALYTAPLSITAVYSQGQNYVWTDDNLDTLKRDLVVTANYSGGFTQILPAESYTLTGNLTAGESVITVTYRSLSTVFSVNVTDVGTELICPLNQFAMSPNASEKVRYRDGYIWMKCLSEADITGYRVWAIGAKPTLWDNVIHKKLRIRISAMAPNWSGDMAADNRLMFGVCIAKNANLSSGTDRQRFSGLDTIRPTNNYVTYEYIFDAEIENFTGGSGTPTNESTFGATIYLASYNEVRINQVSVREVIQ